MLDSKNEINLKDYKMWIQEKLISNLLPGSVLVIDNNAPYHNVVRKASKHELAQERYGRVVENI